MAHLRPRRRRARREREERAARRATVEADALGTGLAPRLDRITKERHRQDMHCVEVSTGALRADRSFRHRPPIRDERATHGGPPFAPPPPAASRSTRGRRRRTSGTAPPPRPSARPGRHSAGTLRRSPRGRAAHPLPPPATPRTRPRARDETRRAPPLAAGRRGQAHHSAAGQTGASPRPAQG